MKVLSLRRLAVAGALSIAGLSLIGVGTNAVFTVQTSSSQQITSGTVSVAIWSPSSTACNSATADCQSLTLPPVGPTISSFTTGDQVIAVTNDGNVPLNELDISFAVTNSTSDLASESYACLGTTGTDQAGTFTQLSDNPLADLVGASSIQSGSPLLAPGSSYYFVINVYAGAESTACGSESTTPLDQVALSQSVTVTTNFRLQD